MTSTALVTAASGKTGRHVVSQLRDRGVDVRAGSRTPGAADDGVTPVRFDLNDPSSFDAALDGVDAVYLVAVADVGDTAPLVDGLLDRVEAAGSPRLVLLSAMGAEQAPDFGLGRIERLLAERAAPSTVVAPNWFSQNFDQSFFLPMVLDGTIRLPAGDGAVSFVDTRDIAAVAVAALLDDGHVGHRYELTGPGALTFGDVARVLGEVSDRTVEYVDTDEEQTRQMLLGVGMDDAYAGMMLSLFGAIRAGYAARVTDAVERVTGRAAISFADYAKQHADAWRR